MAADVSVENCGSIFLFFPRTPDAIEWIKQWVDDGYEFSNGALVVEHRYARDIAQGMVGDGLEVV